MSQGADSKREMNAFNPAALSPFEVQGSPLMRQAVDGDSALLLGGDLMVSVREVPHKCPSNCLASASQHQSRTLSLWYSLSAAAMAMSQPEKE